MANAFDKTSFIPQKSINTKKKTPRRSLLFSIAVLVFVIAALSSVGVFAYKKVLEQRIESKAVSLERAQEAFDPGLIEELTRLDKRIESSEGILSSHVLVTPLLSLLEEFTLKNVQFNQFNFNSGDGGEMVLSMTGQAVDYATVVLQSDLFGQNRFLKNQVFSNINLDNSGNVGFLFKATIDPSLVSFRGNVEGF